MEILRIAGQTDIGSRRKDNQDTYICQKLGSEDRALLAAIDGVGGYAGGEKAAGIAKAAIAQYMASPKGDTLTMLREAVVFANNQIVEESKTDLRLSQMCCVLTTAVVDAKAQKLFFVHVGDTRLYRLRAGSLVKLSNDHSMVGIREDANELTEEEAMKHPRRNEIMREVGLAVHRIDDPDFLDFEESSFLPGDLLMLCSDGLSDMLTRAQMQAILERDTPLERKASELIDMANQQGGNDNITVVLARNLQQPAAEKPPVSRRITQEFPASLRVPVDKPELLVEATNQPTASSFFNNKWLIGIPIVVLLGILGIAGIRSGWFNPKSPSKPTAIHPSTVSKPTEKPGVSLDTLLARAQRSPDRHLKLSRALLGLTGDTLKLAHPIDLKNIQFLECTGNPLLIIPSDSTRNQVAIKVAKDSRIQLKSIVLQGFKVGILTAENVSITLKEVYFKGVGTSVLAEVRQDSLQDTELVFLVRKPILQSPPKKQ